MENRDEPDFAGGPEMSAAIRWRYQTAVQVARLLNNAAGAREAEHQTEEATEPRIPEQSRGATAVVLEGSDR